MDNKDKMIFDLGFHVGDDTAYYLHLGYKVIAIEANNILYKQGKERFSKEILEGRLVLLNKAFNKHSGLHVDFYINPDRSDLSTCDKSKVEYWDVKPIVAPVETLNYSRLIETYGMPYYIKCDIEGLDYLLIKQISEYSKIFDVPECLSFELSRFDYYKIFSYLYTSGYTKFQLINQTALEKDTYYTFGEYSSGKFGKYLPESDWLNFDECLTRYMKYKELKGIDNKNLALGWVDIHARI
jgi:FkbM family methyltransferase